MQSVQVASEAEDISGPLVNLGGIDVSPVEAKKLPEDAKGKTQKIAAKAPSCSREDVSIEAPGDDWAYYKSDN